MRIMLLTNRKRWYGLATGFALSIGLIVNPAVKASDTDAEADQILQAIREANVDWQIRVQTGDRPLPMKYIITSTWVTGVPQYEIRLRDWNTNPQIDPGEFTFTIPKSARRLEGIPLNDWNTLLAPEEGEL